MKLAKPRAYHEKRRLLGWVVLGFIALAAGAAVMIDVRRAETGSRFASMELTLLLVGALFMAALVARSRFYLFRTSDPIIEVGIDDEAIGFNAPDGTSGWMSRSAIEEIECTHDGNLGFRDAKGDVLHIATSSKPTAVIAAVEAGGPRRALRVTLGDTQFIHFVGGAMGLLAGVGALGLTANIPSATLGLGVFLLAWYGCFKLTRHLFGPDVLVIGADGLALVKALHRRFVAFGEIEHVEVKHDRVSIRRARGPALALRARHLGDGQAWLISKRVAAAQKQLRGGAAPVGIPELERGSRPLDAWRQALAGLTAEEKGYRTAAVTVEDLLSVLSDPQAGVERQLGAALALSLSPKRSPEIVEQIQLVAHSSASEAVRRAFMALAEGECRDEVLEEALAGGGKGGGRVKGAKAKRAR